MEVGNKAEMNLILRQYKYDSGAVNFPAVLKVPTSERIPMLAKQDFQRINMLVIGALTVAVENLNVKKRLNEIQILDLSETIIDSANEDNLSFEDLMLFLQKLTRGEYKLPAEMSNYLMQMGKPQNGLKDNLIDTPDANYNPVNYVGASAQDYNNKMQKYQADRAIYDQMISGIMGGVGAVAGFPGVGQMGTNFINQFMDRGSGSWAPV